MVACCLVSCRPGRYRDSYGRDGAMVVEGGTEENGRWSAIPVQAKQGARRLYGDGDAGRAGDGQGTVCSSSG
jgi:hypothetical protein